VGNSFSFELFFGVINITEFKMFNCANVDSFTT
jgi:hypothetical protein